MRRTRLESVLGFCLLITGIIAIANGGLEAAIGPRIDRVFNGAATGNSTRLMTSLALGALGVAAGTAVLVISDKPNTSRGKAGSKQEKRK